MTGARPPASRLARADPRPLLVTLLVVSWLLLSSFGALRALFVLAGAAFTSATADPDPAARAAAAAPDLVSDETRQLLASRAERTSLERSLASPLLLFALAGTTAAVGLLMRRSWSPVALWTVGALAIGLSVFHASRSLAIAAAPAADMAGTDPDAAHAVALLRASVFIGLALQSIPLVLAMGFLRHGIVRGWVRPAPAIPARPTSGPDPLLFVTGAALVLAAGSFFYSRVRARPAEKTGAGVTEPSEAVPGASETFHWSGQPISFSPPPRTWTRERHAEGGRKGVRFTRHPAPPSRIVVAEASLSAPAASVEEILPRFRPTPEQFRSAESALVGEPVPALVAGLPAFQTDYTLRERAMQHRGRHFLAVAGGHAFEITFLGRESDLPILENLVASVRFPEPGGPRAGVRTTVAEVPAQEEAGGVLSEIRVGGRRVSVRIPPSFERIDYGERQEFRHGEVRIALVDGGEIPPGQELDDERLVDRALRLFEHDPRRWAIGGKTRLRVGSREALAVDTWDPLSHAFHKRTVLFLHDGRLLVAGTTMGAAEATKAPLDAIVRSVRFPGD